VLCVRRGPKIVLLQAWSHPDARGEVLAALFPWKAELKKVNVDSIGIGYHLATHLRDHGLPVREVNVGAAPRDKEKYCNLKAELYWGFRRRAMSGDVGGWLHTVGDEVCGSLWGIKWWSDAHNFVVSGIGGDQVVEHRQHVVTEPIGRISGGGSTGGAESTPRDARG